MHEAICISGYAEPRAVKHAFIALYEREGLSQEEAEILYETESRLSRILREDKPSHSDWLTSTP